MVANFIFLSMHLDLPITFSVFIIIFVTRGLVTNTIWL